MKAMNELLPLNLLVVRAHHVEHYCSESASVLEKSKSAGIWMVPFVEVFPNLFPAAFEPEAFD